MVNKYIWAGKESEDFELAESGIVKLKAVAEIQDWKKYTVNDTVTQRSEILSTAVC